VAALSDRPTKWLEASSAAWTGGEAVYLVGLVVYAYRTGGAPAVALVALLQSLPSVVLAPLAMWLGGAVARDRLLRIVLAARVGAIGLAAAALVGDAPATAVYGLATIDAVGSTLLRPLRGSLIPMIARSPAELISANVAITTGASAAGLVGPGVAAIALALAGPEPTFVVGTLGFVIALALAVRVRPAGAPPTGRGDDDPIARRQSQRRIVPAGASLGALARLGAARTIVGVVVGQRFVRGMLSVLVATTAIELFRAGDEGVGMLTAAIGFGGLLGSGLSITLVTRRRLAGAFSGAIAVWGLALAAPGLVPLFGAAIVLMAVSGAGKAVLEVAGASLLQRTVPTADRGMVLGVLESLVTLALAAGAVSASLLVERLGPAGALLAAGTITTVLVVVTWPAVRAADDAAVIPDRELSLLRGVPFFRPLQLTTLEALAGSLARVAVPAGSVVVREGDPGDRFFIVESGRLRTTVDGRPIGFLGPGDFFGEIALLRDVPRTATVEAIDPATLHGLGREPFLAAVTGHAGSSTAAETVVRTRLQPGAPA